MPKNPIKHIYGLLSEHLNDKYKFYKFVFIPIAFVLLLTIRFNGQDLLIEGYTSPELAKQEFSIDINNYISYVDFFKSDKDWNNTGVDEPYIYRPFSPYIASLLPFESITSLNTVNVILLAFSVFLVFRLTSRLPKESQLIAVLLFIFSFPFIYYGSVGNIDPGSVFFILLGIFLYERYGLLAALLILPIALIQKEVTLLYLVYIAGDILKNLNLKNIIKAGSLLAFGLLLYLYIKSLFPDSGYIWTPESSFLNDNLYRVRAYIAPLLSFGLPTLFVFLLKKYWKWERDSKYLITIAGIFALVGYAFISAYVDGRFVFVGIAVVCIYASILLDRAFSQEKS